MPAWRRALAMPSPRLRSGPRCRRRLRRIWCPERRSSDFVQRRQQVLDQIVGVLESGRKSDQPIPNAELRPLIRRKPLMCGRGRMRDQTLCIAEVVGDADQLQPIEETEGAFLAAFDFEGAKRRAGTHLLPDYFGLRMIGTARIN